MQRVSLLGESQSHPPDALSRWGIHCTTREVMWCSKGLNNFSVTSKKELHNNNWERTIKNSIYGASELVEKSIWKYEKGIGCGRPENPPVSGTIKIYQKTPDKQKRLDPCQLNYSPGSRAAAAAWFSLSMRGRMRSSTGALPSQETL